MIILVKFLFYLAIALYLNSIGEGVALKASFTFQGQANREGCEIVCMCAVGF